MPSVPARLSESRTRPRAGSKVAMPGPSGSTPRCRGEIADDHPIPSRVMSCIRTIGYDESEGPLRRAYYRLIAPGGQIDRIMQVHSLRPHTIDGHMALYKRVLHHA